MINDILLIGAPFAMLAGYGIVVTLIRWIEAAIALFFGSIDASDCDR